MTWEEGSRPCAKKCTPEDLLFVSQPTKVSEPKLDASS